MSKCPKCKKEITELDWSEYATVHGTFDGEHNIWDTIYYDDGELGKGLNKEFFCSECGELVATTEKEAKKILGLK